MCCGPSDAHQVVEMRVGRKLGSGHVKEKMGERDSEVSIARIDNVPRGEEDWGGGGGR